MEQGQARKRARELSEETGRVHVADVVRPGQNGRMTRGGWPSVQQTWAVFDYNTGELVELEEEARDWHEQPEGGYTVTPASKRESDDLTYGPGEEENDEADEEFDRG